MTGDDRESAETDARSYRPGPDRHANEVACLSVVGGDRRGDVIAVLPGTTHVGRGPACHVQLRDDGVSRRHVELTLSSEAIVTIRDSGSTNGTFVNGARITTAVLRDGDRVQVGPNVTLRFGFRTREELGRAQPTKPPPPGDGPLSQRELEVASAAAGGQTNAQIGKSLHISPSTVKTHLRNIYERIDVHSRVGLSRWLREHGYL